jgi:hypothetical protein
MTGVRWAQGIGLSLFMWGPVVEVAIHEAKGLWPK